MRQLLAFTALALALSDCSPALDLGSNDAGIPYDADCKPGIYTGSYMCTTSPGSLVPLSGNGPISIMLVPSGARALALTPDASLPGTSAGTTSSAILSGVLDCTTRKLTGMVGDVTFSSATFNGTITGSGPLEATYDADASPPALIAGILNPPASLSAMCTWSATLE
jgi:hypothetical protein